MNAKKEKWYFTFGSGHFHGNMPLAHRYVVFEGSFNEAREKMLELRGPVWSFQYDWDNFEDQVTRYGLTEITVEDLTVKEEA